jgi:hypothetical protein
VIRPTSDDANMLGLASDELPVIDADMGVGASSLEQYRSRAVMW